MLASEPPAGPVISRPDRQGESSQIRRGDARQCGIREPFVVQWKGRLPAGKVYDEPVISLDILPTSLAAAGVEIKPEWELDGVNLLPFLSGEKKGASHDALYWRFNIWTHKPERDRWAIREGNWVLLQNGVGLSPMALYNLAKDPGQRNNLAKVHPERVSNLRRRWDAWNAKNAKPGSVQ